MSNGEEPKSSTRVQRGEEKSFKSILKIPGRDEEQFLGAGTLELAHLSWSSSCWSLCRINSLSGEGSVARASVPSLRLRAKRMLFVLFHAFMIFGLAVFLPMTIFLEYRLFLCPKLVAEFFYRQGTDVYQILRQDAPSSIAMLELTKDCLLNHYLKTPK